MLVKGGKFNVSKLSSQVAKIESQKSKIKIQKKSAPMLFGTLNKKYLKTSVFRNQKL